jgi:anaerobic selenocysteine-containing dehydrogenase
MRQLEPGVTTHHSVCPLDCADTCSLSVEVKDNRISAVRGSQTNPFTRGKICTKVATGLPLQVHGEQRLTQPLLRNGPRGAGAYLPISWQQALDTIHDRYQQIIAAHGPQAIVPLSYGGPMGMLAGNSMDKRFFNRLGATQVDASPLCAGVSTAAWTSVFGDTGGISFEEIAHSKLIVVWGNNITVCNLHLTKIIREARSRGAKLVVVDPKRIRIAEESDLHLPLTPGTDVVLAYAVATLLESQGQLDSEFIARHVEGAEAFLAEARKYPLQEAARLCGLEVDDIARFASWWGELSPAAISMGVAPERNRNGGAGIRAAFALPALTGNFGFPGAGVCDVSGYFPIAWDALKRPDLIPEGTRKFSVLDIADKILDPGDELPIKSVFIYNHNPVAVHPDQQNMRKALMQEDLFVVGSDISMTDSMALADIILPATTHLEYGDLYKSYGHHYLQRSEAVIPPVGEALPNTELFRRLAARFDFEESCFADTDADLVDQAVAASSPGMNNRSPMQHLVDEAIDMSVGNKESLLRDAPPATPSSKIELYSASLEESCGEGLPHFKPMSSDRRFIVISPSSDKRTNSTFGGVTGHDEDMVVEMNPADAASLSLAEGEKVRLFNEQGDVVLPLVLNLGVRESVLYVPKGAWLKSSLTGHTVNALIPSHRADLAGGACYNDCRVDVETYAS